MRSLLALMVLVGLVLAGCGGGSSSSPQVTTLSGTAAAGAAIIGQVTVKDSSTPVKSKSAVIEANGNYSVDVSGMTAPYVLRAEGTVGGRTYKLHSYAVAEDVGATVNITPFTDLIVANAAGQLAETLFDNGDFSGLTSAEVEAQETALQAKLQNVLTSLGVDAAVDLLHTAFSADHTALDAALDLVRIETDPATIQATITNLIDNTSITDNLESTTDNTEVLPVISDLGAVQTSQQAIYSKFDSFSALFVGGLPSSSQLSPFLAADFLQNDQGADQFITELTTDPSLVGLSFSHVVINGLDEQAGTASVTFNVTFAGVTILEPETWQLAKNGANWELRGNQEIVDRYMGFICDYRTENGVNYKTCGINLGLDDKNFTNNGTGGSPIASAKVTLVREGVAVPGAVIYMGVPAWGAAGELRIFDNDYSDDFMAFGSGADQIDPALFQVGDLVQFELFTAPLDTATPAVSGTAVATYATPVMALPISNAATASYPSATQATLDAFNALTTAGGNLNVAWSIPAGQHIDEIAVTVNDGSTWVDVWEEGLSGTSKTLTIDTSSLNPANAPYHTELRVYSMDAQNRSFLRTYIGTTDSGGGSTPTTPTTLQVGQTVTGSIVNDFGHEYVFAAIGGTQYTVTLTPSSPTDDPDLFVFDSLTKMYQHFNLDDTTNEAAALRVGMSNNGPGTVDSVTFTAQASQNYYILLNGPADQTANYSLRVSAAASPSLEFTTALLDEFIAGGGKISISYPSDSSSPGYPGTTQENFTLSGNSTSGYAISYIGDYFDANGTYVSSEGPLSEALFLQQNGTLDIGNPSLTTWSIVNVHSANLYEIAGTDGVDSWTDFWYINTTPPGWLTAP
ncbi:hypothetical protein JCM30471_31120 [Desulfuromonas carbonis]|uniref:hypothetical protein n=1 Tax=Desulfuromonas sp. DDH964 TaxID=1823759 RepID=UPI00078B8D0C|nr:hypothetical protein [Desulfuromonas sp. DDH964]AMV71274.1 lipoprotein cytochrome c [Desulfuromonas sp. DDH964]